MVSFSIMSSVKSAESLAGCVALVTGSAKRLGRAVALRLAEEGADVIIHHRSSTLDAQSAVAEIEKLGRRGTAMAADPTSVSDIKRLFDEAAKQFGRLDILVNNAGIYEFLPLEGVTEEHFHRQFDLNVLGLVLTSKEAAKYFDAAGGSIINISSLASSAAPATGSVYSATKAGVDAVTRSLATELGPRNIRVNAVNPGIVETEGTHSAGITESDFRKNIEAQTPLGRIGQPEDIAPAVTFFASADSSWITGETLLIAGGYR